MLLLDSSYCNLLFKVMSMNERFYYEFYKYIEPIINHSEFQKLKGIDHHGITRYDHCLRVAYYSFLVTKVLHLHCRETTEAALLHDFFTDEVKNENGFLKLCKHPGFAVKNAKKFFSLTPLQEDIISSHMFPITLVPPKYIESWIVDFVDDISAIYERVLTTRKQLAAACTFLFLLFLNFIRMSY